MKRICDLFFAFLLLCSSAQAQREAPENLGFVRFINLVEAGEGKTDLNIDGAKIWKKGYSFGQRTGGLAYKRGNHEFSVSKAGCLTAKQKVKVEAKQSLTLVGYAEESFDEDGQFLGWQIKLANLKQHSPEKGFSVTFVSFCKEKFLDLEIEEVLSRKKLKQAVAQRRVARLNFANKSRMKTIVSYKGEILGAINVDEPGNYVAMIYDGEDGMRKLKYFYDAKFTSSKN